MPENSLKILLLTHDVSDPATSRRAAILIAGGAKVSIAGFRRVAEPILELNGSKITDFGRTKNADFIQRIFCVLQIIFNVGQYKRLFADADIVLARNLEMLAIAVRGQSISKKRLPIVYEVLDIHRLLLRPDIIGKVLRFMEGWLSKRSSGVITSSPAYIKSYFQELSLIKVPIQLVENKLLDTQKNLPLKNNALRPTTIPWQIGWFGIIRCKKSLKILCKLLEQSNGLVEVIIRGRPALDQIPDFYEVVNKNQNLKYLGTYENPQDLASIYGEVHFSWAIDMFEEGLNSKWLLPNRLYEGCYYGAVPLALQGVETSDFLNRLGVGVSLAQPLETELTSFFSKLTPELYSDLNANVSNVTLDKWIYSPNDCSHLVKWLSEIAFNQTGNP